MEPIILAFVSVVAVSLIALVGILFLAFRKERIESFVFFMVSLAVGSMFGNVFFHLLPEAFEEMNPARIAFLVLGGMLAFFVIEKFLHWRHVHFPHHDHEHEHVGRPPFVHAHHLKPFGYMNLISDGLHNFVDGVLIGASYLVSIPIGIGTTIAVFLHEIPQEVGDFGILLKANFSRKQAVVANFGAAVTAIAGTAIALFVGANVQGFTAAMIPIIAGMFIYIAGSDLMPELHKEVHPGRSFFQFIGIGIGVLAMFALTFLE